MTNHTDALANEPAENKPPIMAVGGVVYRKGDGGAIEIVLIRKEGGFWTLPKGRVKKSETETDAIMREMREEISLDGIVEAPICRVAYEIHKGGRLRSKEVHYYLIRAAPGEITPSDREKIRDARWFVIDEALQHIQRERVQAVVEQAWALLQQE